MFACRHFVIGDFEGRRVFLPDREYGLALDALVKGCADVLVTHGDRILLGKRCVEPQPDWWFVGGRTRPGESPVEGAQRNVKRELGMDLEVSRFEVVACYSFVWRMRQQAPVANGTADVSTVLELRLTAEEEATLDFSCFDKAEYADARWLEISEILRGDNFNPALQQGVRDLVTKRAFQMLVKNHHMPAAIVAYHARNLVQWHASAPSKPNEPLKVLFDRDTGRYDFKDPITNHRVPRPQSPRSNASSHPLLLRLLVDAALGPALGALVGIFLYKRLSS